MTNPGKRWSYYFKKLKAHPERYQVYLEKDKQRKKRKKERKAKVLSPADLAKKRRECRERVRSHRLKKKKSLSVPNTSTGSADEGKVYKTLQALRNSVSRVKQVLPNSPRKRRAVISKLAKSVDGISSNSPNPHRNGNKQLRKSCVKCVQAFFTFTQFYDKHLGGKIMCQYGQKGRK